MQAENDQLSYTTYYTDDKTIGPSLHMTPQKNRDCQSDLLGISIFKYSMVFYVHPEHWAHDSLVGGNSNIFLFSSYLGKIPILTNIFQMGWNHQLVPNLTWAYFF